MMTREQFAARLERFSALRRGIANGTLAYQLGALALGATLAALLLLAGWIPNAFINLGIAALLAVLLLVLAGRYLRRRERFRSHLHEAFEMEALADGVRSRLVSAWDFLTEKLDSPLTGLVITAAEADLQVDLEARIARGARDRRRRQFLSWLAVVVVVGLTPWLGFARSAQTLHRSWIAAVEFLFPIHYTLVPGAGRHLHTLGETEKLAITFDRKVYEHVTLLLARGDTPAKAIELPVDGAGTASYALTSTEEAQFTARFHFGQRESEVMSFIFTTRPELANMQTELVYPGYTRMLPRTLEGIQQRLVGLVGTRVTLGFTFSKELKNATITWDDGTTLPLEVVGRYASTSLLLQRSRQASLQVVDQHDLRLVQPVVIDLDAQVDEPPQVHLPSHLKEDMPMLPDIAKIFGFGAQASDDYGVARCILHWEKATVDNPTAVTDRGEIERLISPPRRKALVNFDKVFETTEFRPGDKISFFVEVIDNRNPDPQHARSARRSFFIYQQELAGLDIKELGFGAMNTEAARLAKARRATSVKEPSGQRTSEKVANTFEAPINSGTLAPTVHGEYRQATGDYFKVLSKAVETKEEKKP